MPRSTTKRTRAIAAATAAVTSLILMTGCGGGSDTSSSTDAAPTSVDQQTSTEAPNTATDTASDTPTDTTAGSTQADVAAPTDPLTGYGATRAAWDANHTEDTRAAPGAAYDQDPNLAVDGDYTYDDKYFGVSNDPRITVYQMRSAPGTSISDAKSLALSEFPADATISWFQVRDTCAQMMVHSATLAEYAGDVDPSGTGLIELSSGSAADSYDPNSVTTLLLNNLPPTDAANVSC